MGGGNKHLCGERSCILCIIWYLSMATKVYDTKRKIKRISTDQSLTILLYRFYKVDYWLVDVRERLKSTSTYPYIYSSIIHKKGRGVTMSVNVYVNYIVISPNGGKHLKAQDTISLKNAKILMFVFVLKGTSWLRRKEGVMRMGTDQTYTIMLDLESNPHGVVLHLTYLSTCTNCTLTNERWTRHSSLILLLLHW